MPRRFRLIRFFFCVSLIGGLFWTSVTRAEINIFATVPEWGALAQELGGDKVKVFVATVAAQDPHHIQARPALISRARNAQLLISTGADLEVGWLPIVQRDSGNPAIQPGQPGEFVASKFVTLRDIPKSIDRSMGDVHAEGNPHIQTDPRLLMPVAKALSARMIDLDPDNRSYFESRLNQFIESWQANLKRWDSEAAPLRGVKIWAQHDGFPYMNDWLGLVQVGTLEPKPGVEPSVAYLTQVLARQKTEHARMIVVAAYLSASPSKWLSEKTGLPVATLPFTVGGSSDAKSLTALYDDTVNRLLKALQQSPKN
ncbi:MAG TPA: zinc ABC transporter substrate-binding protein [Alcaligenaceae bacterium]|nr:zinc ABC transporter substrate-binding protein [Alcaligenaceae bacterium]